MAQGHKLGTLGIELPRALAEFEFPLDVSRNIRQPFCSTEDSSDDVPDLKDSQGLDTGLP